MIGLWTYFFIATSKKSWKIPNV